MAYAISPGTGIGAGEIISTTDARLDGGTVSTSLMAYRGTSTDPVTMYAKREAFRTVTEFIASNLAQVPMHLYSRDANDSRTRVAPSADRVAHALKFPGGGLTRYRLMEALELDFLLHDRFAALKVTTPTGELEFIRLPAHLLSFALDPLRRIVAVVVHTTAGNVEVPIGEVIYDVGYDPYSASNRTRGLPVATGLEASATELDEGAEFRRLMLANGPRVPMYVSRPAGGKWADADRDRFVASFKEYSGAMAGRAPLLEDGMKLESAPQLKASDAELNEARKEARLEMATAFHVPPELIGWRTGTNSNILALREQLYQDVLGPRFVALEEAFNMGLRDQMSPEMYVEANVDAKLRSSFETRAQVLQSSVGAPWLTVNEARKQQNLPAIAGGDDLVVPLNVTKGGLASPRDTGPKALAPAPHSGTGARSASDTRPEPMLAIAPGMNTLGSSRPEMILHGEKAAAARDKHEEQLLEKLRQDMRAFFTDQGERVMSELGDNNRPMALGAAFDTDAESDALYNIIYRHNYQMARFGADGVLDAWNPDRLGFNYETMLPWLAKAAGTESAVITNATFDNLVSQWVKDDWKTSMGKMWEALAGPDAGAYAQGIATTAQNFGARDAAGASRLNRKRWIHRTAGNPRASHKAMNGMVIDSQEVFPIGARWPGESALPPGEWVRCRCTVEWFREDEGSE